MALKEKISVYLGTTEIRSFDATVNFTTNPIKMESFKGWTLSAWFNVLNGVNPKPKLTIEVSNSIDPNSFTTYLKNKNIKLPNSIEDSNFNYKFLRFVYKNGGVQTGSLITFDFTRLNYGN